MRDREVLRTVLCKLGCPAYFLIIFKELHRKMKAQIVFNSELSHKFLVDNSVKLGDIPAPTHLSIYFAVLFWMFSKIASGESDFGQLAAFLI